MSRPRPKPYALPDGTTVPSVTQVLGNLGWKSYGLMYWAHGLGKAGKDLREERQELAEAGQMAHALAQADIAGLKAPAFDGADAALVTKATDSYGAYLSWKASTQIEPIATEVALVSETHRFGGRLDAIVNLHGQPGILDFKSSKTLYGDHVVQLAAYAALWNENRPDLTLTHWNILRWAPDGTFAHHALSQATIEWGWKAFQACLILHQAKQEIRT